MKHSGILLTILIICSCTIVKPKVDKNEKFEPEDGKCILFIGQDLGAIGGLESFNDGYVDHIGIPGGITMYTNLRPGDTSFGYIYKGLDGLTTTDNWGSGECNMQLQMDDADFKDCALAIGLELVNHDSMVAVGLHDELIVKLGRWIGALGNRPVFLRIGYEFDAPEWNGYRKDYYKASFRRIRNICDSLGINNIAYVWQSKGWGTTEDEYEEWYPGDEYVDWCGYTHFIWGADSGKTMIDFARKHSKPVFIAEATPMLFQSDTLPIDCFLENKEHAAMVWESWFKPFFRTISEHDDVVKAVSYINVNWREQAMWKNNITFRHVDSRLQANDEIRQRWEKRVNDSAFLKASPWLFNYLENAKE